MKKFTKFLALVALSAGLLMAGCEKDNNGGSTGDGNNNGGGNNGGGNNGGGGSGTNVEWVDLGLPSGLLWCSHNVGASNPEDYGDYFAWGETQPKSDYKWSTYCYSTVDGEGVVETLTKYNTVTEYGTVDSLTILEPGDDAATALLGNGARTPTREEWQELIDNTTIEWTTLNDVNGRRFTAHNGNSIFLPAAGNRYGSDLLRAGTAGSYWSASLDTEYPSGAWRFYFSEIDQGISHNYRYYGFCVRAVRHN